MTARKTWRRSSATAHGQQGNDFSKIQARFKTRLKLTSADVEEVIRAAAGEERCRHWCAVCDLRRAARQLQDPVRFRRRGQERLITPTKPISLSAPTSFVSYQFLLFQAAIEGISDHNVFEGRNSSVGEAFDARRRPAGRQGHWQRRGRPPRQCSTACSPASVPP